MNRDEILAATRALVADSLAVPIGQVKPESRLINDLEADSLDFVDILFQVEKKFGVKLRTQDRAFLGGLDFSSPAMMRDGVLTPETVETLKEWVPALNGVADSAKVTPAEFFSMISVATLCLLVEKKVAGKGASSTAGA